MKNSLLAFFIISYNDAVKDESPTPKKSDASPLKKGRCSRCGKHFAFESIAQHKSFPFCSERCRDIDLGSWMTGKYAIPGKPIPREDHEQEDGT